MNTRKADSPISLDDLHLTQGVNCFNSPGKKNRTLSVKSEIRRDFFSNRPELLHLLQREEQNPLLEEGHISIEGRERAGEYYLTHEAITLLVERKFRNHTKKRGSLPFNRKAIFIAKNDVDHLLGILQAIDLENEGDAKIIYISGIHAVPCYLRNISGVIHCFIVDSEAMAYGDPDPVIISCIKKVFPGSQLYISTTTLQKDYYSCSTFAIKALQYFCKHGKEVFPWLSKYSNKRMDYSALPPEKLMPPLLKMLQTRLILSYETLDSIVCHKRKMTLREYFVKHTLMVDGLPLNTSALLTKYKYFQLLHQYVERCLLRERINNKGHFQLPKALHGRHMRYDMIPVTMHHQMEISPVDVYLGVVSLCNQDRQYPALPESEKLLKKIIRRSPLFKQIIVNYNYGGATANDKYRKTIELFIVAAAAENSDIGHIDDYSRFANKLLILFTSFERVVEYLRKFAVSGTRQPVHDICIFAMPTPNGDWNIAYWSTLLMEYGAAASCYLDLAPQIEKLCASREKEGLLLEYNNELEKIIEIAKNCQYSRAKELPALAELAYKHKLSEKNFNKCLTAMKNSSKTFDFLPDITIQGQAIGSAFNDYRFTKLPVADLRGLFLGEYSSCCQSVGKAGETCAINGMTSQFGGFYVVLDTEDKIIAQSWAWLGNQGELVFDSWEYTNKRKAFLFKPFITKAAEEIIKYGFKRVLIGDGGHTPHTGFTHTNVKATMIDKTPYTDADKQLVILEAKELALEERFKNFCEQTQLDFVTYKHLFAGTSMDIASLNIDSLPFNDFFALIRFNYNISNEFLHNQTSTHAEFLINIIRCYGGQMAPIFNMKSSRGSTLSEMILKMNRSSLLIDMMTVLVQSNSRLMSINLNEKIDRLLHVAVRLNSFEYIPAIYQLMSHALTWDQFLQLQDATEFNIMQLAAKKPHMPTLEYLIKQCLDSNVLFELLKKKCDENESSNVLNIVIKEKNFSLLKYIESRLTLVQFHEILSQHLDVGEYHSGPNSIVRAFVNYSSEIAEYLMVNYAVEETAAMIARLRIRGQTAISMAVKKNGHGPLALLHKFHKDEDQWIETIHTASGGDYLSLSKGSLLYFTLAEHAYESALYIITSINNFEIIHHLLTKKESLLFDCQAIDHLKGCQPNEYLILLYRKLIEIYATHRDKFKEIFLTNNRQVMCGILNCQNPALFTELLDFICRDQTLFYELLHKIDYNETIIETIIKVCDERKHYAADEAKKIPFAITRQYIDAVVAHCSPEQLKFLLNSTKCFGYVNSQTLEYLLTIVEAIDDGHFIKKWLIMEDGNRLFGITRSCLVADNSKNKLLEYADKFYGKPATVEHFINDFDATTHSIVTYPNICLLQYLFPDIAKDEYKVRHLFSEVLLRSLKNDAAKQMLAWLISQSAITGAMLDYAINDDTRIKYSPYFDGNYYNLSLVPMIWQACKKRCERKDQLTVIYNNFYSIFCHYQHLTADMSFNQSHKASACYIALHRQIYELLRDWLVLIKQEGKFEDYMRMRFHGNSSLLDYAVQSDTKLTVMLLNLCNQDFRLELVASTLTRLDNKDELLNALQACEKLDILERIRQNAMSYYPHSSQFFRSFSTNLQVCRDLFQPIADMPLVLVPQETIDQIWNGLNQMDNCLLGKRFAEIKFELPEAQLQGRCLY